MNCRTGNILIDAELEEALRKEQAAIMMKLNPTEKQLKRIPPRVGRNEPYPCGSGLKFKKCHLIKDSKIS